MVCDRYARPCEEDVLRMGAPARQKRSALARRDLRVDAGGGLERVYRSALIAAKASAAFFEFTGALIATGLGDDVRADPCPVGDSDGEWRVQRAEARLGFGQVLYADIQSPDVG